MSNDPLADALLGTGSADYGMGRARNEFYARVAAQGGTVTGQYLNARTPVAVTCSAGHECTPRPGDLQQGQGICRYCKGPSTERAIADFMRAVDEQRGTVVEPRWLGNSTPHRVICAAGHECAPTPGNVKQGQGLCGYCTGASVERAVEDFMRVVAERGATVVEPRWLGALRPHRVVCAAGHESNPRPNDVQQGQGLCRVCAGKDWDAFYVVGNAALGRVKFGVTTGDPRHRLQDHCRDGYTFGMRLVTEMPDAYKLEQHIVRTLRDADIPPVQGREYYGMDALPVVLDVADNWNS